MFEIVGIVSLVDYRDLERSFDHWDYCLEDFREDALEEDLQEGP